METAHRNAVQSLFVIGQSADSGCTSSRRTYFSTVFEVKRNSIAGGPMSNMTSNPVIGGTKIRMFRGGSGQPVVFLHGAAGLSVWTPFFQALSENYDVRVPEHPGFGQSDNPEW